jgi:hypothetical protein
MHRARQFRGQAPSFGPPWWPACAAAHLLLAGLQQIAPEQGVEALFRLLGNLVIHLAEQVPQLGAAVHRQQAVEHRLLRQAPLQVVRVESREHFQPMPLACPP